MHGVIMGLQKFEQDWWVSSSSVCDFVMFNFQHFWVGFSIFFFYYNLLEVLGVVVLTAIVDNYYFLNLLFSLVVLICWAYYWNSFLFKWHFVTWFLVFIKCRVCLTYKFNCDFKNLPPAMHFIFLFQMGGNRCKKSFLIFSLITTN